MRYGGYGSIAGPVNDADQDHVTLRQTLTGRDRRTLKLLVKEMAAELGIRGQRTRPPPRRGDTKERLGERTAATGDRQVRRIRAPAQVRKRGRGLAAVAPSVRWLSARQ